MICSATINGIGIGVRGTPEECAKFFREFYHERHEKPAKKACDPYARHIGNRGAEDCPIFKTSSEVSGKNAKCGHPIERLELNCDSKVFCTVCGEKDKTNWNLAHSFGCTCIACRFRRHYR